MMNRIQETMNRCFMQKEKALACFLTAGFPTPEELFPLVGAIERGGADIIELGMPFSDPLADGPIIQHSSQIALQQGVTLEWILSQVRLIRNRSNIPIVLMGYLNPILAYGSSKFFTDAASAGVDGFILPELPLEESDRFIDLFKANNLANILLVTPTTLPSRISLIDKQSSGFLYCVSTTGVTGSSKNRMDTRYIQKVKSSAKKNPVLVGFGIRTAEDARHAVRTADGVIIGSALIEIIGKGKSLASIESFVRGIKTGMQAQ
jgi:tryptophan synthase alpha chain